MPDILIGPGVGLLLRRLGLVVLFCLPALAAQADANRQIQSGDFSVQIDVSAQANLIHHLDCLAGLAGCTKPQFEALWRDQLGLTAKDKADIEAWGQLRRALQRESGSGVATTVSSPLPLETHSGLAWTKIRQAGFLASTREGLRRDWKQSMGRESLRAQFAILDRFRGRFRTWWSGSEQIATSMLPALEAAMEKARGPALLRQAARFLGAELGERRVYVHLIVQPGAASGRSSAEIVDGHMLVEIVPGERAADRVPVIVHELAHHVWARVPVQRKAFVVDEMLRAGRDGVAAWNLFDEVQATVIGNMLAGRNIETPARYQAMLERPQSFYADAAIDGGARASSVLFERALGGQGQIDGAFIQSFVEALRQGLRAEFGTPMLLLRNAAVNTEDAASPWIEGFGRSVNAWGLWTYSGVGDAEFRQTLELFPAFSAAVFVTADQLQKVEPLTGVLGITVDELRRALDGSRGVAMIADRTPNAIAVVFVARDADVMDRLLAAVATCALKAGVCARVP